MASLSFTKIRHYVKFSYILEEIYFANGDIFTKSVSELVHWIRMQFSCNYCKLQVEEKGNVSEY